MQPLHAILNWWESVDDFNRPFIAMNVLFRLAPNGEIKTAYERLFRDFLTEVTPAVQHIGRVVAIRAVIDFWFVCERRKRSSEMLLNAVEECGVELKSLANSALGREPQLRKVEDAAFDTWQRLREGAISDDALVSAERRAGRRPQPE